MKPDLLQRIKSMLASRSSPYGIKAQIPVTRGLTLIQPARETTRTVTVSVSNVQRLFAVIDVPHNFELFHFYFQDLSSRRPSQQTFHFLYLHQSCPELHQSPGVGFPGQLTIEQSEETRHYSTIPPAPADILVLKSWWPCRALYHFWCRCQIRTGGFGPLSPQYPDSTASAPSCWTPKR